MKIEEVEVTKRVMTKTLFKFMANPRKSNESLTDSLNYNLLFQGLTGISLGLNQDASFYFAIEFKIVFFVKEYYCNLLDPCNVW